MARNGHPKTFLGDFKVFFGRGLAILLPSILTLWILWQLAVFVYNNVGDPINRGIRLVVIEVTPRVLEDEQLPTWFRVSDAEVTEARALPEYRNADLEDQDLRRDLRRAKFREFWNAHWYLEATGIVVAIVLLYFAGMLLGGYLGRRIYTRLERLLSRMPGFKQVYPHVKQVVEMIMGDTPLAFNRVVVVQYPREGIWTVGLMTGASMKSVHEASGRPCVSVFIPSTPTPFTGFTITVPAEDTVDLPVSVEEAIRFFITGGVLVPEREVVGEGSGSEIADEMARRIAQKGPDRIDPPPPTSPNPSPNPSPPGPAGDR